MHITVMCPACGQVMRVAPVRLGRTARCVSCDDPFLVSDRLWYYKALGKEQGPIGPEVLASLAGRGMVTPETLVRKGESGRWVPAGIIHGLFPSTG